MSEHCELGRGLRRREKNANDEGAGHFEKPAPDARAAPPEAHESLISRETVAEVLLTGLSFGEHVVCISKFVPIEGKDASAYADSRNALPNRYASPLTSPLRANVSPDGENHFRFDLEP